MIQPNELVTDRGRRQADASAPPQIDVISEGYRRLYLHLAATGANVPAVTVAGDDGAIVATVAANIAAAAAYEARSTLLVDVDPTSSTIAAIFRVPSNPGLSGIIAHEADWPEATVQATIGRDRGLDVLPSGTRRLTPPKGESVSRIREDFERIERRYDLVVVAAPIEYLARGAESIIPSLDVILCVRVGHTRISRLKESVEKLRALDLRIHGLVLWDDDMPVIEAHDEPAQPLRARIPGASTLVGAR